MSSTSKENQFQENLSEKVTIFCASLIGRGGFGIYFRRKSNQKSKKA